MAMRMAVMALRKAADARMNRRKVIRVSHSSLSRRVMEETVYRQPLTVNSPRKDKSLEKKAGRNPGAYKSCYFASGGGGEGGGLAFLVLGRFTCSSPQKRDGKVMVVGAAPRRV